MDDNAQLGNDPELFALCEAVCVGQATDKQITELEQRMRADHAMAKVYLNCAALHADLFQVTSAKHGGLAVVQDVQTERSQRSNLTLPRTRVVVCIGAIAAMLFVAATAILWRSNGRDNANQVRSGALPEIDGTAVICGATDIVWSENGRTFQEDQLLKSDDWLAIESGNLEIELGQGAVVVLEGPARFAARSTSVGQLDFGRLAAVVPPWAKGFRVDTANLRVVDHGTKFELEVTRDQQVDVAVTEGEVELLRNYSVAPADEILSRLTEGQATRTNGDRVEPITAAEPLRNLSRKLPPRPDDTEVEVVAKYRRDFVDGTSNQPRTTGRWRYYANCWAPVGGAEGYSELLWDSKRQLYDPNGDQGKLAGSRLHAANLSYRGGHPGSGRDQSHDDQDHYVIAAYDVPRDGLYRIEAGWLVRSESREDIANQVVDVVVHVNENAPLFRNTCNQSGLLQFGGPLGFLQEGDRIYVAVGPHGIDFNDRFEWDFAIVREKDPRESTVTETASANIKQVANINDEAK